MEAAGTALLFLLFQSLLKQQYNESCLLFPTLFFDR